MDIKAIVAKQNPESLSLRDQARYKVLPDSLTIKQIAELLYPNNRNDKEHCCTVLRNAVLSGELFSHDKELAKPSVTTTSNTMFITTTYYDGNDAPIHKDSFKEYVAVNNWDLSNALLNNWFNKLDSQIDITQTSTANNQDDNNNDGETLSIINPDFFKGRVKSESVSLEINHQTWALHNVFPVHIAAALWCGFNPHYFSEWGEREYIEVHNTVIVLLTRMVISDIENNRTQYSREQLDNALKVIIKRLNSGVTEFIEESRKYNITRHQLKEIAEKVGAKPKFLYLDNEHKNIENDIKTDGETELTLNAQTTDKAERELTQWLRETWIKEGKPKGTAFFNALKKYKGQKGSPIIDHYSAGKYAGIKWQTSAGNTGELSKKTIQNKPSEFKKTSQ